MNFLFLLFSLFISDITSLPLFGESTLSGLVQDGKSALKPIVESLWNESHKKSLLNLWETNKPSLYKAGFQEPSIEKIQQLQAASSASSPASPIVNGGESVAKRKEYQKWMKEQLHQYEEEILKMYRQRKLAAAASSGSSSGSAGSAASA